MGSLETKMKAAQWDPKLQKVVVNTIPIPEPRPNQILVKLASASLCHSDLMAIGRPDLTEPFTIGHEGAGYVYKIGTECQDKGFQEGDPVGFLYINGCCFECEGCMHHNNQCSNGTPVIAGFAEFGFFQEYAPLDWQNVIKLPAPLLPENSSAIFCAGITSFHAVDSCELQPGQWLGVVGAGGLGQLATQYAKAMGYNVIAIDINDKALQVCKEQGADITFNSRTDANDYVAEVKRVTNGGLHAVAVFSAAPAAYKGAPPLLRPGGLLMAIGISPEPIQVSTFDLACQIYRVKAESTSIPQRMKKAVDFTAEHKILPEVEVRSGLEDVDNMVREMKAGESTKRMAVVFK